MDLLDAASSVIDAVGCPFSGYVCDEELYAALLCSDSGGDLAGL